MTSPGENVLQEQISELKKKIAILENEIKQLQKCRNVYIAKMQLMENHLNPSGYHGKGDADEETTDSSDDSLSTTELLELSLSSISSSILGSNATPFPSDPEDEDSESHGSVERGERVSYRKKSDKKEE